MILGIQMLGVLFGLLLIYITFVSYKRGEFTIREFGFWCLMAGSFAVISLFPNLLDFAVKSLSLSRTMDLLIILGFMFVLAAVFYTYMVTRKNQRRIEEVVRKIALKR